MKKILSVVAVAVALLLTSCGSQPVKTIENLKAAATGEANASAKYAKFAEKAAAEGYNNVAALFAATSNAEAIHAANHMAELAALGVTDFAPVIEEVVVDSTLANLINANEGEVAEFSTMYPGFMETAVAEKAEGANLSFDRANRAEQKHAKFYSMAIECLQNPEVGDAGVPVQWAVCTVCGDTYTQAEAPAACELCGTLIEKFTLFPATLPEQPAQPEEQPAAPATK